MASTAGHTSRQLTVLIPDTEASERMGLARRLAGLTGVRVRVGVEFSSSEQQLVEMTGDADVLAVALARVSRRVIESAPQLRLIVKCGIGTENIDVAVARARGIVVARTSGINFGGVAEFVIGACIALYRRVPHLDAAVPHGEWTDRRIELAGRLPSLEGKLIGLVGFGAIAREVARLARAHRMTVLASDPYVSDGDCAAAGVTRVELDELLRRADIVSVHVVLTSETRGLLNAARLALMPSHALLVNTARGGIVDQAALTERLATGRLAGAVLDVLEVEPPDPADPLLRRPNCLLSPHLAGCTTAGYEEIGERAAALIAGYIDGRPIPERDVVNA